ncbi:DUF2920 family protein [Oceanobacillus chungangensis]|uniref:DUF2920 domain-containing protein n=1 Tax=Oceanobacillus chungangensis TaxID=1229152 RepID=A0A3D8PZJ2_9BACI|nr:DUF2920 family protein [Oceanobacillus chungangensis]RDW20771.1 hypothetical protein CWR45_05980 [Oceanobacillus chungangensis]
MAKENHINIPAHYNIYTGENTNRNLDIYFSEPEYGVNKETGLLLLIPGYGAHSQSNVYKKMRLEFADKYNLIVIQCDYFGSEFMQTSNKINLSFDINNYRNLLSEGDFKTLKNGSKNFNTVIGILSKYSSMLQATEILNENKHQFNDMGFMQAMDLLTALFAVKLILDDNQLVYDENKVIAYGHSHGAYLAYLCNRLAPNDFTFIVDNSAWLNPVYLTSSRYLNQTYGKMVLQTRFDYFARKFDYDKCILDLHKLYDGFQNKAVIWSYQGVADNLVDYREKERFCSSIDNVTFHLIDEEKVDNIKYFSAGHGLNADFLNLFDYTMRNVELNFMPKINSINIVPTTIVHRNIKYIVDFRQGLPVLNIAIN